MDVHSRMCDEWCCFLPPLRPTVNLCLLQFHSLCTRGGFHSACCLFIYAFLVPTMLISYSAGDYLGLFRSRTAAVKAKLITFYAINAFQWPISDLLIYKQCDHCPPAFPHDMVTGESCECMLNSYKVCRRWCHWGMHWNSWLVCWFVYSEVHPSGCSYFADGKA